MIAVLGAAALASVLPTPLRGPMHDLFGGGGGAVGPITGATAIVFWAVALLLTARGLRHGHRLALALTLAFLGVSIGLHLARHDDQLETILLCIGVVGLVLGRHAFRVPVSVAVMSRVLAVAACVLLSSVSAGMLRRDWTPPSGVVPLGFGSGVVPTALLAFVLILLVSLLWAGMSSPPLCDLPEFEHHLAREQARRIVNLHGSGTLDYFALRDDRRWFFQSQSVVAYTVRFGVCLVSPDPVGPPDERRAVWAAFLEHVSRRGWSVSVLAASPDWVDLYRSFGMHPIYLGDEAVVDCPSFSLDGRAMRGLRQACNRVDRAGCTVSFHDPAGLDASTRSELLELASMSRVGEVERGFSMTLSRLFEAEDTGLMLGISRDHEGRARAFTQWMPAPGINGWSLDVMRYDTGPETPNGVMEHLIVQTIRHLARRGETGLSLNFAVVRTLVAGEPSTTPRRLGQFLLHAVSGRAEIASLCRYNQKFRPTWQPRYVLLSQLNTMACQGLAMAAAEGLSELPVIGRFMTGAAR